MDKRWGDPLVEGTSRRPRPNSGSCWDSEQHTKYGMPFWQRRQSGGPIVNVVDYHYSCELRVQNGGNPGGHPKASFRITSRIESSFPSLDDTTEGEVGQGAEDPSSTTPNQRGNCWSCQGWDTSNSNSSSNSSNNEDQKDRERLGN